MKGRSTNRFLMFLLCIFLIFSNILNVEASDDLKIPLSPPNPEGEPTPVEVAIFIIDIDSIDSVDQAFEANVFIILKWNDPRIASVAKGNQKYSLDEIWNPSVLIANESGNVRKTFSETVEVDADGSVIYRQRYVGTFSQPLNLRDFPFDSHSFAIQLVAQGLEKGDIQFLPYSQQEELVMKGGVGISKNISLPDWTITEYKTKLFTYEVAPSRHIPGYEFQFTASRDSWHYIWKVILPLVLIVGMSCTVFWIHPSHSAPQISVAVTSMLTLIANRFNIDLLVPKVEYMTRLDKFILSATILVFLALVQAIVTGRLYANNKITISLNIDRWCRIIFPVAFLLTILTTLLW